MEFEAEKQRLLQGARATTAPASATRPCIDNRPKQTSASTTQAPTASVEPTPHLAADSRRPWWAKGRRAEVALLIGAALLIAAVAVAVGGSDGDDVQTSSTQLGRPANPSISTSTSTSTSTTTNTEPPNPVESREFTSGRDYPYYVEVEVEGPDPTGSASVDTDSLNPLSCIETARPGETNLWFRVSVTNLLDDREANAPVLEFDTNLTNSYDAQQKEVLSVEERLAANFYTEDLSIIGNFGAFRCANSLFPPADETIPAGGTREYVGIVGQLTDPVPDGLVLLISGAGDPEPWIVPLT